MPPCSHARRPRPLQSTYVVTEYLHRVDRCGQQLTYCSLVATMQSNLRRSPVIWCSLVEYWVYYLHIVYRSIPNKEAMVMSVLPKLQTQFLNRPFSFKRNTCLRIIKGSSWTAERSDHSQRALLTDPVNFLSYVPAFWIDRGYIEATPTFNVAPCSGQPWDIQSQRRTNIGPIVYSSLAVVRP